MKTLHENGMTILKTLNDASFEAYFVGGYVRDTLLGLPTKDIDITTNARPEDIKALFKKVIPTGAAFGTMSVIIDGAGYEITTYRKETVYDNHRHPNAIAFADTLKEDLKRRDFTINQLTMNHQGTIGDMFNGLEDLRRKMLRTIGDPNERFYEDALRMLRAFRFMARLDFSLETKTLEAIKQHKSLIKKNSIERIQEELFRLFDAPHTKNALETMVKSDIHTVLPCAQEAIEILSETTENYKKEEAFTVLDVYSDIKKGPWKLSKKFTKTIHAIKTLHEKTMQADFTPMDVFTYTKELALKANTLNLIFGGTDQGVDIVLIDKNLPIRNKRALNLKGSDLLKHLTFKDKRHISIILDRIIEDVVNGTIENSYKSLLKHAREYLNLIEWSHKNGKQD